MVFIAVGYNSTNNVTSSTSDDGDLQQVSGQSVFWIIIALALNAMAQSSITTDLVYNTEHLFRGGLSPQLSSPIICACDALIEFALLVTYVSKKLWRSSRVASDTQTSEGPLGDPEVNRTPGLNELVGVRTVLFLLAVLPPAIKVFGMNGVPGTQILVAAYLAPSATRTLTFLAGPGFKGQKKALFALRESNPHAGQLPGNLESIAAPDQTESGTSTDQGTSKASQTYPIRALWIFLRFLRRNLVVLIARGIFILHFSAYIYLWFEFTMYGLFSALTKSEPWISILNFVNRVHFVIILYQQIWAFTPLVIGRYPFHWRWWPRTTPFVLTPYFWYLTFNINQRIKLSEMSDNGGGTSINTPSGLVLMTPPLVIALFATLVFELAVHRVGMLMKAGFHDEEESAAGVAMQENAPQSEELGPLEVREYLELADHSSPEEENRDTADWFQLMLYFGKICLWWPLDSWARSQDSTNVSEKERLSTKFSGKRYWDAAVKMFWVFLRCIPRALRQSWFQSLPISSEIVDGQRVTSNNSSVRRGKDPEHALPSKPALRNRIQGLTVTLMWATGLLGMQMIFQILVPHVYLVNIEPHFRFWYRCMKHLRVPRRFWTYFGLFNLLSALQFCMLTWQGEGTVNPPWTSFLGR